MVLIGSLKERNELTREKHLAQRRAHRRRCTCALTLRAQASLSEPASVTCCAICLGTELPLTTVAPLAICVLILHCFKYFDFAA